MPALPTNTLLWINFLALIHIIYFAHPSERSEFLFNPYEKATIA
jgi:hypothetical protein